MNNNKEKGNKVNSNTDHNINIEDTLTTTRVETKNVNRDLNITPPLKMCRSTPT